MAFRRILCPRCGSYRVKGPKVGGLDNGDSMACRDCDHEWLWDERDFTTSSGDFPRSPVPLSECRERGLGYENGVFLAVVDALCFQSKCPYCGPWVKEDKAPPVRVILIDDPGTPAARAEIWSRLDRNRTDT